MSLADDANADTFFRHHPAQNRAAVARLERHLDIRFGDDCHPADAHVEGVEAIFRIDVGEEFLNAGKIPFRDFQVAPASCLRRNLLDKTIGRASVVVVIQSSRFLCPT